MLVNLLGVSPVNFQSEQGQDVRGVSVYFSYPNTVAGAIGDICERKFIKGASVDSFALGVWDFDFNTKGQLISFKEG